jgi:hypothetical protein
MSEVEGIDGKKCAYNQFFSSSNVALEKKRDCKK